MRSVTLFLIHMAHTNIFPAYFVLSFGVLLSIGNCVTSTNTSSRVPGDLQTVTNVEKLRVESKGLTLLGREIYTCGWDHVIVVSEITVFKRIHYQVFKTLSRLTIPFTVYLTHEYDFTSTVYHEYVKKRHTNFMIISDNPVAMLSDAARLFDRFARGVMACFPHRSNWVIIQTDSTLFSNVTVSDCTLDHVSWIHIEGTIVKSVRTLMWREKRRREWQSVAMRDLGDGCYMYPNKRNGLNGRVLTWVFGPLLFADLFIVSNNSQGQIEYGGYLVEATKELEKVLNFTSIAYHDGDALNLLTKVDKVLRNKSADISNTWYSQNSGFIRGIDTTFPLRFDYMAAAYMYVPTYASSSFPKFVLMYLSSILFIVLFYYILNYTHSWILNERYSDTNKTDRHLQTGLDTKERFELVDVNKVCISSGVNIPGKMNDKGNDVWHVRIPDAQPSSSGINTKDSSFGRRFLVATCRRYQQIPDFHVMEFFGTAMNQDTVVRPENFVLRVSVFFWCMLILVLGSLLTATLTAGFVKPVAKPPFTSLSQVLESDQILPGTFHVTEVHRMSRSWQVNGKKWSGHLEKFPISVNSPALKFREIMEEPSPKPKVFIYFKSLLQHYKKQSKLKYLYITQNNHIATLSGLTLPPKSELTQEISNGIIELCRAGIFNKFYRKYYGESTGKDIANDTIKEENEAHKTYICNIYDFFLLLAFLLVGSFFILIIEVGVKKLLIRYDCVSVKG